MVTSQGNVRALSPTSRWRAPGAAVVVALALLLAALPGVSHAQVACDGFCQLDIFDGRVNGSLRTQGPWRTNQPGATDGATVSDDVPVGFSGKAMVNDPDGVQYRGNASATLGDLAVPADATGTLLFEFATEELMTTTLHLGLSHVEEPALGFEEGTESPPPDLAEFAADVLIDERGLVVRDGGTDRVVDNVVLEDGGRYLVWLVADNAADSFQVHVQPGSGDQVTATADGKSSFAFRTATDGPLVSYLNSNDPVTPPSAVTYIDNLYVAPTDAVLDDPTPRFEEVHNLDDLDPGALDGQNGWVADADVSVTSDPDDDAGQVLDLSASDAQAYRGLDATIAGGGTGTMFFRVRRTGNVNLSAGLSDVGQPSAYGDYEAQANAQNGTVLNARDGGAFTPAGTIADEAWQCVWLVADTAAGAYEMHVRGGEYDTKVQLPEDAAQMFGFRNGTTGDELSTIFLASGDPNAGQLLFADFAIDQDAENLRVPSGDATDCAGTGIDIDAPIADPIPEDVEKSGLGVRLDELTQVPASSGGAQLARINHVSEVPDGSNRLAVPDLNGPLYLIAPDGAPTEYLDARDIEDFVGSARLGTGLAFVAFHPAFAENGRFYTVHTEDGAALTEHEPDLPSPDDAVVHSVVREWTAADPGAETFSGDSREVLRIGYDTYLHGMQQISFNPTAEPGTEDYGLLYVSNGDGEENPNWTDGPQDLGVPQGKVLRIDPEGDDSGNGRYGIPASNPFVDQEGALGEVFVYGLRNPHRYSWDTGGSGELVLTNIGEKSIESIYLAEPGDNYGWNVREGGFRFEKDDPGNVYPLPEDDEGFTYPVAAHDREIGFAIAGGFVYRGSDVPELTGKYVFGDIVNGRVFYTEMAEMERGGDRATIHELALFDEAGAPTTMRDLAGSSRVDFRIGADAEGELYVTSKANGKIWTVASHAAVDACAPTDETVVTDVLDPEDWNPISPEKWEFTGEEGVLLEMGTPPEGPRRPFEIATLQAGPEYTNVRIDAAVRIDEPVSVNQRDVVLVFGYQSPTRYYYAHLSQDNTIYPHNGIFLVDDADRERIDDQWLAGDPPEPAITDSEYHQVQVRRCTGTGKIEIYVDDLTTPLMTATDDTLDSGRVGFGSFDNYGRIADLVVSGEPVIENQPPAIEDLTLETEGDTAVQGQVEASDPDGDELTYAFSAPASGTVEGNQGDGSFTYTPNAGYVGPDTFEVTVDDGSGGTATALVQIVVEAAPPTMEVEFRRVRDVPFPKVPTVVRFTIVDANGDPVDGLDVDLRVTDGAGEVTVIGPRPLPRGRYFALVRVAHPGTATVEVVDADDRVLGETTFEVGDRSGRASR